MLGSQGRVSPLFLLPSPALIIQPIVARTISGSFGSGRCPMDLFFSLRVTPQAHTCWCCQGMLVT